MTVDSLNKQIEDKKEKIEYLEDSLDRINQMHEELNRASRY